MPKPQEWVTHARRMVQEYIDKGEEPDYGVIADKMKMSKSSVYMRAGPDHEAYTMKDMGTSYWKFAGFDRRPTIPEARAFLKLHPDFVKEYEAMSDRDFTHVTILYGGVRRPALRIDCSKKEAADCLLHEEFSNKTGNATSPVHAATVFRNHGWAVGGGPRADVCPKCLKLITDARREKKQAEFGVNTPVTIIEKGSYQVNAHPINGNSAAISKVQPVVAVPVPTTLTLKDVEKTAKRLIDEKLDEVYDAKRGGYIKGYSDDQIAEELATLPSWVALVRDFGHGPATSAADLSGDIRLLDEAANKVMDAKRTVDASVERLTELDKALNERLANFEKSKEDFQKVYNALKAKVSQL